jgi:hypothetical protein
MFVLVIGAVSLFSFCIIKMNRIHVTMNELMSQLFYLQDSVSVLQSDMGTMETNIEAALEEESSLSEDFSVSFRDFDFEKGTYAVDITALPKEYTEATQLTVYFGTKGYNLELQGILFKGSATLSTKNNYDGNVTVLITNGEKRSTEVINNYKGFQTILAESIGGSIDGVEDRYRDGVWDFSGSVNYALDGQGSFEFKSFHLIAEVGADTVYDYDLIRETGGAIVQETPEEELSAADPGNDDVPQAGEEEADAGISETTDVPEEILTEKNESISSETGAQDVSFTCEAAETDTVRFYLEAVTKEGIRLQLVLFEGVLSDDAETRMDDLTTYSPVLDYFDRKDVKYE